jgi:hypothetical protein
MKNVAMEIFFTIFVESLLNIKLKNKILLNGIFK